MKAFTGGLFACAIVYFSEFVVYFSELAVCFSDLYPQEKALIE